SGTSAEIRRALPFPRSNSATQRDCSDPNPGNFTSTNAGVLQLKLSSRSLLVQLHRDETRNPYCALNFRNERPDSLKRLTHSALCSDLSCIPLAGNASTTPSTFSSI